MSNDHFPLILEMKSSALVESLMRDSNLSLADALNCVYRSKLYEILEREETKLWHHSPLLLLDCLKSEMETGTPELPDE